MLRHFTLTLALACSALAASSASPVDSSPSFSSAQEIGNEFTLQGEQNGGAGIYGTAQSKVPIHLGVMSKCPDAQICEIEFDRVLDNVGALVTIDLVYIGQLDSSQEYGVSCMHGPSECLGNIQQLCVAKGVSGSVNPWADWWNFVQCVNYGPTSRIGDTNVAKSCAKVVGHTWDDAVEHCVSSDEGAQLLRDSVTMANTLELKKSCTIVINGKQVCVHDGTWKSCPEGHEVGDFVRQIKQEWRRLNNA